MPDYRRVFIPGGTYFFTIVTFQRKKIFVDPDACILLKAVWRKVAERYPFITDAFCLLPDHFHCVITLPENDSNFPMRIREIKRLFTSEYKDKENHFLNNSKRKRAERYIWQRRYWEHLIRDERDLNHHIEYTHFNPVRHGYVSQVKDWEYSSFHRFVVSGLLNENWGEGVNFVGQNNFGE